MHWEEEALIDIVVFLPLRVAASIVARKLDQGRDASAVSLAKRVAYTHRSMPDAGEFLYTVMKQTGAAPEAIEAELRRGIDAIPWCVDIGELLVWELGLQRKWEEAKGVVAHFDQIEVMPTCSLAMMRAMRASIDGNRESSRAEYLRALSLIEWDTNDDALFRLAISLLNFPEEEQRGIDLLERLVNSNAEIPLAYVLLALALEEEDPQRARRILEDARHRFGAVPEFETGRIAGMREDRRRQIEETNETHDDEE